MKNILIILGIIFVLTIVVFLYKQQLFIENFIFSDKSNEEQEVNNDDQIKETEDEIDSWQLYINDEAGFSIKYPQNAVFQGKLEDDLSFNVLVTNIDNLGYPGFGEEEALKNMEFLNNGEYGDEFDWPLESSKKVTKVENKNMQEFMVLGRFEICDVVFERKLILYNNDYQIEITLRGDRDKIVESMPQYFKTDSANCEDDKIWDFDKQNEFYQELFQGKGSVVAQEWFDFFDEMVKTIEFISSSINVDLIQGRWTSLDDENSVIEFNENVKIDFYSGEEISRDPFEFKENNQYLKVVSDDDVFEYKIDELSENSLILMFLPRGNILRYTK